MKVALSVTKAVCRKFSDVIAAIKAEQAVDPSRAKALTDLNNFPQNNDHTHVTSDTNYRQTEVMVDFIIASKLTQNQLTTFLEKLLNDSLDIEIGYDNEFMRGPCLSKTIYAYLLSKADEPRKATLDALVKQKANFGTDEEFRRLKSVIMQMLPEMIRNISDLPRNHKVELGEQHELQEGEVSSNMSNFIINTLLTKSSVSNPTLTFAEAITQNPTIKDISAIVDLINAFSKSNTILSKTLLEYLLTSIRAYFTLEKWEEFCRVGHELILAEVLNTVHPQESGAAAAASGKEEEDDADLPDIKIFLAAIRKQLQKTLVDLLQLNTAADTQIAEGGAAADVLPKRSITLFKRIGTYMHDGGAASATDRMKETNDPKNKPLFSALLASKDDDQAVLDALTKGPNLNARYFNPANLKHSARTPIMIAIALCKWGPVEAILEYHINPESGAGIDFTYNGTTGKSTAIHLLAETKIQALDEKALASYEDIVDTCLSGIAADPASKKIFLMKNAKHQTILDIAVERDNTVMIDAVFKYFHISEIVSPEQLTETEQSRAISEFLKGIAPSYPEEKVSSQVADARGTASLP